MNSVSKANKEKYKHPPTIEMMRQKAEDEGVSVNRFATHYGLSPSFFRMILAGMRHLPSKYWHIFYETSIKQPISLQKPEKQVNKTTKRATDSTNFNHGRLASII